MSLEREQIGINHELLLDNMPLQVRQNLAFSRNGASDEWISMNAISQDEAALLKRMAIYSFIDDPSFWEDPTGGAHYRKKSKGAPIISLDRSGGDDDILGNYLKDMRKFRLLNYDEEVALAKVLEAGRDTNDPEVHYYAQASRDILIRANTRLAINIAKKYMGRGLDLPDLIQEANIGLIKATDRYDWRREVRFSTYATWWIRQSVSRGASEQGRAIRLPINQIQAVRRMQKTAERLELELGRDPTEGEIADRLDVSEDKVRHLQTISYDPVSLDRPSSGGNGNEDLYEILDNSPHFTDEVDSRIDIETGLREAGLTEREFQVISARFIKDGLSLAEIAEILNWSRETIRKDIRRAEQLLAEYVK